MKALNYKGKHFILADDDYDDDFDDISSFVDAAKVASEDVLLRNHIEDCRYYGIPVYLGKDKVLKARIEEFEKELNALEQ